MPFESSGAKLSLAKNGYEMRIIHLSMYIDEGANQQLFNIYSQCQKQLAELDRKSITERLRFLSSCFFDAANEVTRAFDKIGYAV